MWVVKHPQPHGDRDPRIAHYEVYCKHIARVWCLKCGLVKLRNKASQKEWKAGCKWE